MLFRVFRNLGGLVNGCGVGNTYESSRDLKVCSMVGLSPYWFQKSTQRLPQNNSVTQILSCCNMFFFFLFLMFWLQIFFPLPNLPQRKVSILIICLQICEEEGKWSFWQYHVTVFGFFRNMNKFEVSQGGVTGVNSILS